MILNRSPSPRKRTSPRRLTTTRTRRKLLRVDRLLLMSLQWHLNQRRSRVAWNQRCQELQEASSLLWTDQVDSRPLILPMSQRIHQLTVLRAQRWPQSSHLRRKLLSLAEILLPQLQPRLQVLKHPWQKHHRRLRPQSLELKHL